LTAVRRDRARQAGVIAAAVAGHAVVFLLIGLDTPAVRERIFRDDEPVMVVDLRRPPPPLRQQAPDARRAPAPRPSPVRPRETPRPIVRPTLSLPMAPIPKADPAPAPDTGARPVGGAGGAGRDQPGGDLRGALRSSTVGCANGRAVGLNRRETEACDERFGAAAKDAPFIDAPIGRDKRAGYDARAARLRRDREWREGNVPVGTVGDGLGGEGREAIYRPK